jgi:hypothetical protein
MSFYQMSVYERFCDEGDVPFILDLSCFWIE